MTTLEKIKQAIVDNDEAAAQRALDEYTQSIIAAEKTIKNTPELTAADLVVGKKYVPVRKTVEGYEGLEGSVVWRAALRKKQPYLYYNGIDPAFTEGTGHVFDYVLGDDGDYFHPSDVIPYED